MQAPHILEQPKELAVVGETPRRILIVEDDPSLAEVLSIRLERQGFQTTIVHTGQEGLAAVALDPPDLILLDIRLPDIDGLRLCERFADSTDTCDIPVIILSGMERPDIIRRSRAAGCRYFVRKPYDPNALLILIGHSIGEGNRRQPT